MESERQRGKLPGEDTGIEIRHTVCGMCCSSIYCGVDAYIQDGRVIKVEGSKEHFMNQGLLCAKGQGIRQYLYKPTRLKTPLRRVGERGEGKFEPISWEEAYRTMAEQMNRIKRESGPEAVAFYSGYEKWYRAFFHRFAWSFGSPNYGSESSSCYTAKKLAWLVSSGMDGLPQRNKSRLYMGWGFNNDYSRYLDTISVKKRREDGMKVIVIDPRVTPASEKLADLHLQLLPGTDGALALGLAHVLIKNGWVDREYIEKHVYGYEEFSRYVKDFTPEYVEKITTVPRELILKTARMMWENRPVSMHESVCVLVHHKNGFQNFRAVLALSAILGCYDVEGGNLPRGTTYAHQWAGFETREEEFIHAVKPETTKPRVGAARFPVWMELSDDMQAMDLTRQIMEEKPYAIRGLFCLGLNYRMFPDNEWMEEALKKLDFYCDVDLFMTDSARFADLVLPACTSYEREEFKIYAGGYANYLKPVIPPLFESKPDTQILKELAEALDLKDDLLRSGYRSCIDWIIKPAGLTVEKLMETDFPVRVPGFKPYVPGTYTREGYRTPTGKFELRSTILEKHQGELLYEPLPVYQSSLDLSEEERFPLILYTGASLPFTLHSRMHDMPWERTHRPEAMADMHPEDGAARGIGQGDPILLETANGAVTVKANLTYSVKKGTVSFYHDYPEADVNRLIHRDHLDPISGFPGYRTVRCQVVRRDKAGKEFEPLQGGGSTGKDEC